jgi:hypothetical protein
MYLARRSAPMGRGARGAGLFPITPVPDGHFECGPRNFAQAPQAGRRLRLDHSVHRRSGQGRQTDPEQVVPSDAIRGDLQAGFRAPGSVHPAQGRHQRVCRSFHSMHGARFGNWITSISHAHHLKLPTAPASSSGFCNNGGERRLGLSLHLAVGMSHFGMTCELTLDSV